MLDVVGDGMTCSVVWRGSGLGGDSGASTSTCPALLTAINQECILNDCVNMAEK